MFVGSVPKKVVEQILSVVDFSSWSAVQVCCSGSFRVDRALRGAYPELVINSNDVSLYSVALGRLLTSRAFEIQFTDRLSFFEQHLGDEFIDRVAGVLAAYDISRFQAQNRWAQRRFDHYREHFPTFLDRARGKLNSFAESTSISSFSACDFLKHAANAPDGGGVVCFPPTYKGGYERLYKFIDANTQWDRPSYEVWDPSALEAWVESLLERGTPFCVYTDRKLDLQLEPVAKYSQMGRRDVFTYASTKNSSVRATSVRQMPFQYTPVDPTSLVEDTKIELVRAEAAHMSFLKNVYLKKGIQHVPGEANFLVYLGGQLAGGFIYTRDRYGGGNIYLLSDFSICRERKLSKLIAMLATSCWPVRTFEQKHMVRVEKIETTAFTDKPVSMKYRGVFDLKSRKPGFLQYVSSVRKQTPTEVYREWYTRFA